MRSSGAAGKRVCAQAPATAGARDEYRLSECVVPAPQKGRLGSAAAELARGVWPGITRAINPGAKDPHRQPGLRLDAQLRARGRAARGGSSAAQRGAAQETTHTTSPGAQDFLGSGSLAATNRTSERAAGQLVAVARPQRAVLRQRQRLGGVRQGGVRGAPARVRRDRPCLPRQLRL